MTAFIDSCVETVAGSASAVAKQARGKPRVRALLKLLAEKKNILVTTHENPDPDALASIMAMQELLARKLPGAKLSVSIKGRLGGGLNEIFVQLANFKPVPWDEAALNSYDAILLLDTQPAFANNPLPQNLLPTAVIDHHRSRGRRPKCPFCDIRPDVGATASIIFSYFMELEQPISRDLAATLLFAIESDLAGAAGQPGELDNMALSSLTLMADPRKLYKMRYANMPQSYYQAYFNGIGNAVQYDVAIISHIDQIEAPDQPAVIADFLLRFQPVQWALVTALRGNSLVMSLRTNSGKLSAADIMRKLLRGIGEGGGHRTKAGGAIQLAGGTPAEIERHRNTLRRRLLRALGLQSPRGQRLVNRPE